MTDTLVPTDLSADYSATASEAYRAALSVIETIEPRIADATRAELADQRSSLKLIASENYASLAVLLTMGTWLSDKYAEGTIGHRFYAGCQNVDTVEALAAEHARELFGAEYAYAQPHSGIDANLVAFWAILANRVELPELATLGVKGVNDLTEEQWEDLRHKFGNQRALGMSLDAGGHLTHGFRPNISGKMFHQRSYGTDPQTQLIDYDRVRQAAQEFKPLILIAGYSAYPRRINFAKMREIADEVGATFMVDMAHFAGLVAGKVFTGDEDPVPHAHLVTTTTHKSLRGPRGGMVLATKEYADSVDRGCPMVLGGPLGHVMAAKAVALAEARTPAFQTYAQAIADNAKTLADGLLETGRRPGHRRHRQPPGADRCVRLRHHRPAGRVRAARRGHRDQSERGAVGPERRLVHLRDPDRHAGADVSRLRGRRVRPGRRPHRHRAEEHHAGHRLDRQARQGEVPPCRRNRRCHQGGLGRVARRQPVVSRTRTLGGADAADDHHDDAADRLRRRPDHHDHPAVLRLLGAAARPAARRAIPTTPRSRPPCARCGSRSRITNGITAGSDG